MKIVMTGSTGLVGAALGKFLVREGHEVVALVRHPQQAHVEFPCNKWAWDSESSAAPAACFEGVEAVIHLAGENIANERWTDARKKKLVDSRVKTAEHLRAGIADSGVKLNVFISASGIGYYGDRGEQLLTESDGPGDDFLAQLCVKWEAAALAVGAPRTVLARFGVVLSDQGGFLRQVAPLFMMVGASALGTGKQWFSWIHMDDLVAMLSQALTNGKMAGAVNVVAPGLVTNAQMTKALQKNLKTFAAPAVPRIALKALYGELAEALLYSQRAQPAKLQEAGFKWQFAEIDAAFHNIYPDLQTGELKVVYEHWVNAPLKKVWPFFSTEINLERLTPEFMNFKVTGKSTEEMQKGTLIDYDLKLRGIPMHWRTRIAEWQEEDHFVDEQLKGPYQKWHHRHQFIALKGGTLMRDTVHFKVPFGWLGRLASLKFVMAEVDTIFAYRRDAIDQIFSSH